MHARKIFRAVISAVDYCHGNGIIHGSISLENIIVSKSGETKVVGFGETNFFGSQVALEVKTDRSILYNRAPEMHGNHCLAGTELDTYALGVVLFALLCGKVPFADKDSQVLLEKVKKGQAKYPAWLTTGKLIRFGCLLQLIVQNPRV
jgi:serine/threonine protein kinase